MQVKTPEGVIKDVAIADVTPQNYIVPQGEENTYHCKIEIEQWNRGTKVSRPRIQKFGKRYFENGGLEELKRQGYTVEVLFNPIVKTPEQLNAERKAKEDAEKEAKAIAIAAEIETRKKADNEFCAKMKFLGHLKGTKEEITGLINAGIIKYEPEADFYEEPADEPAKGTKETKKK